MPRFYFHLEGRAGLMLDEEGADYPNAEVAREASYRIARELMASELCEGEVDLSQRIVLHDAAGNLVELAHFASAVTFLSGEDSQPAFKRPVQGKWPLEEEGYSPVLAQHISPNDGSQACAMS